jgi:hypothetical protein
MEFLNDDTDNVREPLPVIQEQLIKYNDDIGIENDDDLQKAILESQKVYELNNKNKKLTEEEYLKKYDFELFQALELSKNDIKNNGSSNDISNNISNDNFNNGLILSDTNNANDIINSDNSTNCEHPFYNYDSDNFENSDIDDSNNITIDNSNNMLIDNSNNMLIDNSNNMLIDNSNNMLIDNSNIKQNKYKNINQEQRKILLQSYINIINRLKHIDNNTKKIHHIVNPEIDKFCNCEIDEIILDKEIYDLFIDVILLLRLTPETKKTLNEIIKFN